MTRKENGAYQSNVLVGFCSKTLVNEHFVNLSIGRENIKYLRRCFDICKQVLLLMCTFSDGLFLLTFCKHRVCQNPPSEHRPGLSKGMAENVQHYSLCYHLRLSLKEANLPYGKGIWHQLHQAENLFRRKRFFLPTQAVRKEVETFLHKRFRFALFIFQISLLTSKGKDFSFHRTCKHTFTQFPLEKSRQWDPAKTLSALKQCGLFQWTLEAIPASYTKFGLDFWQIRQSPRWKISSSVFSPSNTFICFEKSPGSTTATKIYHFWKQLKAFIFLSAVL